MTERYLAVKLPPHNTPGRKHTHTQHMMKDHTEDGKRNRSLVPMKERLVQREREACTHSHVVWTDRESVPSLVGWSRRLRVLLVSMGIAHHPYSAGSEDFVASGMIWHCVLLRAVSIPMAELHSANSIPLSLCHLCVHLAAGRQHCGWAIQQNEQTPPARFVLVILTACGK